MSTSGVGSIEERAAHQAQPHAMQKEQRPLLKVVHVPRIIV
jgi:hypothetical protein